MNDIGVLAIHLLHVTEHIFLGYDTKKATVGGEKITRYVPFNH